MFTHRTKKKEAFELRTFAIITVILWTIILIVLLYFNVQFIKNASNHHIFSPILLWVGGLGMIVFAYFRIKINTNKRILAEESLKTLNTTLVEKKVKLRSIELQKSQLDWENIFNTLDSPAQLIGKDHTIKYVNEATLRVFNLKREDFIGKSYYTIFHLSSVPPPFCPLQKALKSNKSERNEMLIEAFDTFFIVSCSPIHNLNGEIESFMHIMTDITDRKKMEKELSQANMIINKSSFVVFRWRNEKNWPVDFISENIERLLEYSSNEFTSGKIAFSRQIHSEDITRVSEEVENNSKQGLIQEFTHKPYRVITKNGMEKWVCDIMFILRNKKGEITHYEGIINDITNQVNAEKAMNETREMLQKSEEKFRAVFETSVDSVHITTIKEDRYLNINKGFTDLTGYTAEDVIGKTSIEINLWQNAEDRNKLAEAIRTKGYVKNLEVSFVAKNGRVIPGLLSANIVEVNNEPHILTITRDISERKKAEKELIIEKEFSEKIIDTSTAIIVGLDKDHLIKIFNKGAEKITQYNKEDILGKDWYKIFFPKKILDEMNAVWKEAWGITSHSHTNVILNKAGEERIISWQTTGMYEDSDENKNLIISIGEDITEQVHTQELLQKSEEKFRAAFETSVDSVNITTINEGRYVNINKGFTDLTGYSSEEVIGKTLIELNIWENDSDRNRLVEAIKTKGYIRNLESRFLSKKGEVIYGLTSANIVEINAEPHLLTITRDITEIKKAEEELKKYRNHLEELVKERTIELEEKTKKLERINNLFVGRELRMSELKEEIKKLKEGK